VKDLFHADLFHGPQGKVLIPVKHATTGNKNINLTDEIPELLLQLIKIIPKKNSCSVQPQGLQLSCCCHHVAGRYFTRQNRFTWPYQFTAGCRYSNLW